MLAREEKLAEIVRRLQEAAGENLQSVVLYGSAARGDFHTHKSLPWFAGGADNFANRLRVFSHRKN